MVTMHPTRRSRRTRSPLWFGQTLEWIIPARSRFRFPSRATHYAGRSYELVKFTSAQAQGLGLSTGGWYFTEHPDRYWLRLTGHLGPLLGADLTSALMLAEAWLLSPSADLARDSSEPLPDLPLALAGSGPTFHVRGVLMTVWPRPESGCVALHRYSQHLTERGAELGVLEPQFDLSDCPGAEPHGLRWRPRLARPLGGEYLESSLYWREALSTLAHNVITSVAR